MVNCMTDVICIHRIKLRGVKYRSNNFNRNLRFQICRYFSIETFGMFSIVDIVSQKIFRKSKILIPVHFLTLSKSFQDRD